MSGVDTAPAPSAPAPAPSSAAPTPAPAAREVAVDVNPTRTPAPIGSQAPPARQQGAQERPASARESITRAFSRAQEARATPPAQARIGHNNPPEPIDNERPKPAARKEPPIDLRKPPPPERGEHGHFVARDRRPEATGTAGTAPADAVPPPRGPQQRQQQPVNPLPQNAPYREAPPRMSDRAKAEWHTAPESVRGEVHRMHQEFGRAYQQMQADAAAFNEVRPYHELARSQGTTLGRAISNYAGMEDKLRRDPLGGLDVLVHNMNLRTSDNRQITFRDICHYVATQSPEQLQARETRNTQSAHNLQLGQLQSTVAQLADSVGRMYGAQQYAQHYFHTRRAVDRFAETHPRIDELGHVIAAELKAGHNLETAYQRANLLHPAANGAATQAAQTRTQPAQTRAPNRSIHGAPDGSAANGSSRGGQRRRGPAPPVRDSVARAFHSVRGGL